MSIDIMNWVWKNSITKGTERLVLLSLADQANDQGVCWPSLASIARRANVSRNRVIEAIKYLGDNGFIRVTHRSENGVCQSNYYTVLMINPIEAQPEREEEGSDDMVTTPPSEPVLTTLSQQAITTPSQQGETTLVNPSLLKPPINHQSKPPSKPSKGREKSTRAPETNHLPIASAIAKVTNTNLNLNRAQIFAEAKRLHQAGITAEQIIKDYGLNGLWYQCDFRGKKGEAPTIAQIRQTWGTLKPASGQPAAQPSYQSTEDIARKMWREQHGS